MIYLTPLTRDISGLSKLTPEEVEKYFTRNDGSFSFARWGRSVAPVVFGLDDKSLSILKRNLLNISINFSKYFGDFLVSIGDIADNIDSFFCLPDYVANLLKGAMSYQHPHAAFLKCPV